MKTINQKQIFWLCCVAVLFASACRLYTEGNQNDIDKITQKTQVQPFEHLENPCVFALPVQKELYLFGLKQSDDYITETVGGVFAVYDTQSEALFDWAFFEGRNFYSSLESCASSGGSQYYTCKVENGDLDRYNNYRLVRLNKSTGQIENGSLMLDYYDYYSTKNFYVRINSNYDYDDEYNRSATNYTLKLKDVHTFAEKSFSIKTKEYATFFTSEENLYMYTEEENTYTIYKLNDDGSALSKILSFTNDTGWDTVIIDDIRGNYVFVSAYNYHDYDYNTYLKKTFYIYDLENGDENQVPLTIQNTNDIYTYQFCVYENSFFLLDRDDSSDVYSNYDFVLYKSDIAGGTDGTSTPLEKVASFGNSQMSRHIIRSELVGSKLFLFSTDDSHDVLSVHYVDLTTLEVHFCSKISTETILQNQ